jgi:hypothetical protein
MNLAKFERWPALVVQGLRFRHGLHQPLEPLVKKMRFKAAQFYRNLQDAPIINKQAYLFQLDAIDPKPLEAKALDAAELKQALLENQGAKAAMPIEKPKVPTEVDLHIEKLSANFKGLNNAQILEIQVNAFEKALDKAIQAGADEIVFIHGVGGGILKLELQRRLSRHPNVSYFQDAKKEKFGYGATLAVLK